MVKGSGGIVEAHQWSESGMKWLKIGEVTDAVGGSSRKSLYQGKEYDYVFDVDIQDGVPSLKLPFNVTGMSGGFQDSHRRRTHFSVTTLLIVLRESLRRISTIYSRPRPPSILPGPNRRFYHEKRQDATHWQFKCIQFLGSFHRTISIRPGISNACVISPIRY